MNSILDRRAHAAERREVILTTLRENGGSVERAAKALGVSRQAIYKAIRVLGLEAAIRRKLGEKTPRAYRVET